MADQTEDIPNQRGTSSGEIGQNPVEMQRKPEKFADSEPIEDLINGSLGTVITADTMETGPENDNESKDGEGI